ncbi:hypothetical protein J4457_02760 [Candidatus Woesearchaeota archaeon]|nr:hypothetical protein [Candidatus Woesearchaeota archaeon]
MGGKGSEGIVGAAENAVPTRLAGGIPQEGAQVELNVDYVLGSLRRIGGDYVFVGRKGNKCSTVTIRATSIPPGLENAQGSLALRVEGEWKSCKLRDPEFVWRRSPIFDEDGNPNNFPDAIASYSDPKNFYIEAARLVIKS